MKKIAVFTGTRAEYGILGPLLSKIKHDEQLTLQILVSAMHLSPEFGLSKSLIINDGYHIDEEVEMLLSSDTASGCAKSVGLGVIGFADALKRLSPDVLVVLGDRFEALAVVQTAMLMNIPIAHLHGGEITEGAKDDAIRHAITKLSNLHFTANEAYRQRVIQMGEAPESVFNVGALGLENITLKKSFLSKKALQASLGFDLKTHYFVVTYHSVTLANEDPVETCQNILAALESFVDHQVIITYPNADDGGRKIISFLNEYANKHKSRVLLIPTLGLDRFLSAVKYATAVIGNSSSGIIEVPSLGVPTINIGQRQQGRMSAHSVIHCGVKQTDITNAIKDVFAGKVDLYGLNPYASVNSTPGKTALSTSDMILDKIKRFNFSTIKHFYDLPVAMKSINTTDK
ncbi:UDP-N-acetylglucosamine 2-epimerase [Colwellia sp. Bg11-12]|uniref:UDP-N-acetylglucosamine 2-epimerase n=1 Tax=Colwellia sp. Bg11-12 TaxID=2759817 RepID=UPI0015F415AD|nr:UDP-N-acetylglucosamine 2-epimerase [Colwellia sp. Bg11-12]MBA6264341.1 UDP-N-acetylglucosamine 2-epimerase (hydrolyzing) [Colwellia sp. Bg11-12]